MSDEQKYSIKGLDDYNRQGEPQQRERSEACMDFESLVGHINQVQDVLQAQAAHAVNLSLTARNWLVGYYIVEFEQNGEDRAKYGDKLINRLAERLNKRGFNPRRLRDYRHVYQVYPMLGCEVVKFIKNCKIGIDSSYGSPIWLLSTAKLQATENQLNGIWLSETAKLETWATPPEKLFNRLNYTCLSFLATIDEPLKRAFYEQETIRGCWTHKELDRQVSSLYFERMGLSKDKLALQNLATTDAQQFLLKSASTFARKRINFRKKAHQLLLMVNGFSLAPATFRPVLSSNG